MHIMQLYDSYFQSENADPNRDKLFMLNHAVALSDKDFSEMVHRIIAIIDEYQQIPPTSDAKMRNLYLMSAPKGENNE